MKRKRVSAPTVQPSTGRAQQLFDEGHNSNVAGAQELFREIWVEHPPQRAIIERIETLRLSTQGKRGTALPGLRLSQVPQVGKSRTLQRYRSELEKRMLAADQPVNPYRVVYINLQIGVTLKMLCQKVLRALGDPKYNKGNTEEVTMRMEAFIRHRGVELLIVDEVQWLAKIRNDTAVVTDQLKNFLNEGIVPLVLAGNEESAAFFQLNNQLAARLGMPLELSQLTTQERSAASLFRDFCIDLDQAITSAGLLHQSSGFKQHLAALMHASGGYVGLVCRIVEAALEHAIRRDADYIEAYDLSYAVENLAIPAQFCTSNPFGGSK